MLAQNTALAFFASLFSEMFLRAESNPDCAAFRNSFNRLKTKICDVDGKDDDDDDDATATALPNCAIGEVIDGILLSVLLIILICVYALDVYVYVYLYVCMYVCMYVYKCVWIGFGAWRGTKKIFFVTQLFLVCDESVQSSKILPREENHNIKAQHSVVFDVWLSLKNSLFPKKINKTCFFLGHWFVYFSW